MKMIIMQGSNETAFKNTCDFCVFIMVMLFSLLFSRNLYFCKSVPFTKLLMWVELPSGRVAPGS